MEPIVCPETSVNNYQSMLHNIPEEPRSQYIFTFRAVSFVNPWWWRRLGLRREWGKIICWREFYCLVVLIGVCSMCFHNYDRQWRPAQIYVLDTHGDHKRNTLICGKWSGVRQDCVSHAFVTLRLQCVCSECSLFSDSESRLHSMLIPLLTLFKMKQIKIKLNPNYGDI
jgi:hypothetical protein